MNFSEQDKKFMMLALEEAKVSLKSEDYPIGAILVINGEIVAKRRNRIYNDKAWASHAEASLIKENSKIIWNAVKLDDKKAELFTTLEPCLMCLGTCVLHRISRIIFSCPDPHGGATHLDPKKLSNWYSRKWPIIQEGLFREESFQLLKGFMEQRDSWKEALEAFEEMHKNW